MSWTSLTALAFVSVASVGCANDVPTSSACLVFKPIYMSERDHAEISTGLMIDLVYHNETYAALCPSDDD